MNFIVGATADEVAEHGADRIAALVRSRPSLSLGIATGSSPRPLYRALHRRREQGVDFSRISAFALDEYVGLAPDHPESYHSVVHRDITLPLGLDPAKVHVPDGAAEDPHSAAAAHEAAIRSAGVALQILGIGANGHIGFNEPGAERDSLTRVVELAPRTREDNRRFFGGDATAVPERAISQGIATILAAEELLLVASGRAKAHAVADAITGPIRSQNPASFIRLHPRVTLLLDADAASALDQRTLDSLVGARA